MARTQPPLSFRWRAWSVPVLDRDADSPLLSPDDEPDQFLEEIRNTAGRGKRKLDGSSQGSASEQPPASKYRGERRPISVLCALTR